MASAISNSILNAMEIIVNNSIEGAPYDRTVTATIVGCTDLLKNEYKINYQGGTFYAYGEEGTSYRQNQAVYVLIPEGNFSNVKKITGLAGASGNDDIITELNAISNNYTIVGKNLVSSSKLNNIGLCAHKTSHYKTLYSSSNSEKDNLIEIDQKGFKNTILDSKLLLIEGTFRNSLPYALRQSGSGEFGVICVLAFNREEQENDIGEEFEYKTYVFSSDKMLGNPYKYSTSSKQSYAFELSDVEKFSHVENIVFYLGGFVEEKDPLNVNENVFLSNLEIHGLKEIDSKNGEYSLTLDMVDGNTFYETTTSNQASLRVSAKLKKSKIIQTLGVSYYWFREDAKIDKSSFEYNVYAGVGWRKISESHATSIVEIPKIECRAYANKFMCVAVYSDAFALKTEFNIYNDAVKKSFIITSDSGTTFAYNVGFPTLTCLEEDTQNQNSNYKYYWSKVDLDGTETLFTETYKEVEDRVLEIDFQLEDPSELTDEEISSLLSEKVSLENKLFALKNVSFDDNWIHYPVEKINKSAIFKCRVYEKVNRTEYLIGSAEITITNGEGLTSSDYFVIIKNGDQCFQYSESGISPTSTRYQEPQQILPLSATLYGPDGSVIKNAGRNEYTVSWSFPVSNTLLAFDGDISFEENEENKYKTSCVKTGSECLFNIKEEYNSQAFENQITCIVAYQGRQITADTSFSFVKIGEDGTNGTDVVAKIDVLEDDNVINNPFLKLDANNNVIKINKNNLVYSIVGHEGLKLRGRLFKRSEEIENISSTFWKISTANTREKNVLNIENEGASYFIKGPVEENAFPQYGVVQVNMRYNGNSYYAHRAIPYIKYFNIFRDENLKYKDLIDDIADTIEINFNKTLKNVLYNKDGRNPSYNTNLGICFTYKGNRNNIDLSCKVLGSSLNLKYQELETSEKNKNEIKFNFNASDAEKEFFLELLPSESYSGDKNNNIVILTISEENNKVAEIGIPIHFSLNTYGLASLNAWDGNHVEINEEDSYIMAPQIGAGEKDEENKFTGIVMGKASFYENDEEKSQMGLFGFSKGRQSIFLDANTGAATFGINDEDAEGAEAESNNGRISLNPNGESYISSWRIGRKSLYNIEGKSSGDFGEKLIDYNKKEYSHLPENAPGAIHHLKQGIVFCGTPAYLSVKGAPKERFDDYPSDSFEVILQGSDIDKSIFAIYRHHAESNERNNYYIAKNSNEEYGYLYKYNSNGGADSLCKIKLDKENNSIIIEPKIKEDGSAISLNVLPVCSDIEADKDISNQEWIYLALVNNYYFGELKYSKNNVLNEIILKDSTNKNNIAPSFSWTVEQVAGLDEEGILTANAIMKDNVSLRPGYVPTYRKGSRGNIGLSLTAGDEAIFRAYTPANGKEKHTYISAGNPAKNNDEFSQNFTFLGKSFQQKLNGDVADDNIYNYYCLNSKGAYLGAFKKNQDEGYVSCRVKNDDLISVLTRTVWNPSATDTFNYYIKNENNQYCKILNNGAIFKKEDENYTLLNSEYGQVVYEEDNTVWTIDFSLELYPTGFNDNAKGIFEYDFSQNKYRPVAQVKNFNSVPSSVDDTDGPVLRYLRKDLSWDNKVKDVDFVSDDIFIPESFNKMYSLNLDDDTALKKYFGKDCLTNKEYHKKRFLTQNANGKWVWNDDSESEPYARFFKGTRTVGEKKYIRYFNANDYFLEKSTRIYDITLDGDYYFEIEQLGSDQNRAYYKLTSSTDIFKSKIFNVGDLDNVSAGSFLRLSEDSNVSNLLNSTELPLKIDAKELSLISAEAYNLSSLKKGFSLSTEKAKSTDCKWFFRASTDPNTKYGNYQALISNNEEYHRKEGLFFSGAASGGQTVDRRTSLFSSYGFILQNISKNLGKRSRYSLIPQEQSIQMHIQDVGGGGIALTAMPSSLKISESSELKLVSRANGFNSYFALESPRGDIRSEYKEIYQGHVRNDQKEYNGIKLRAKYGKAGQVRINVPLKLQNNTGGFKTLHCGAISTHRFCITTGAFPEDTTKGMGTLSETITKKKGGHIYTRGGDITTNGGDIYLCKGKLRFNENKYFTISSSQIKANAKIKAEDFLL